MRKILLGAAIFGGAMMGMSAPAMALASAPMDDSGGGKGGGTGGGTGGGKGTGGGGSAKKPLCDENGHGPDDCVMPKGHRVPKGGANTGFGGGAEQAGLLIGGTLIGGGAAVMLLRRRVTSY